MYIKHRYYTDIGSFNHVDHMVNDLTTRNEPAKLLFHESTMLIPSWDMFEAASTDEDEIWSVVTVDNYGRETISDRLVSTGHTMEKAKEISDSKNDETSICPDVFFTYRNANSRLGLGMLDYV